MNTVVYVATSHPDSKAIFAGSGHYDLAAAKRAANRTHHIIEIRFDLDVFMRDFAQSLDDYRFIMAPQPWNSTPTRNAA